MSCCQISDDLKQTFRARAAACLLCAGDVPSCPRSRQPVALHVKGLPCVAGKHPTDGGRVWWLGMWWIGLPYLKRLWVWTTRYSDKDPHEFVNLFPGCGCIERMKNWANALEAAL